MTASLLSREEYIEQAYFFRVFRERLQENVPAQEVLSSVREEILATTRLPMAIDFLLGELRHKGRLSEGMFLLPHYFSQFQSFVVSKARPLSSIRPMGPDAHPASTDAHPASTPAARAVANVLIVFLPSSPLRAPGANTTSPPPRS